MISPILPGANRVASAMIRSAAAPAAENAAKQEIAVAAKPSVGQANAWVRYVQGPMLRSMAKHEALHGLVEAIARSAEPLPLTDALVNMHTVVPGVLVRGGQLSKEGLARLASTEKPGAILNFAAEYPQTRTGEATAARALGMEPRELLVNPMSAPSFEQADPFIRQVDAQAQAVDAARKTGKPAPGPLYVHCYAGSDRTGAMVACYRIARQGWPVEKAIAEMRQYGANAAMHPDFEPMVRAYAAAKGK